MSAKAYGIAMATRVWLDHHDCHQVVVNYRTKPSIVIRANDGVRITGLAMGYFIESIVGLSCRTSHAPLHVSDEA